MVDEYMSLQRLGRIANRLLIALKALHFNHVDIQSALIKLLGSKDKFNKRVKLIMRDREEITLSTDLANAMVDQAKGKKNKKLPHQESPPSIESVDLQTLIRNNYKNQEKQKLFSETNLINWVNTAKADLKSFKKDGAEAQKENIFEELNELVEMGISEAKWDIPVSTKNKRKSFLYDEAMENKFSTFKNNKTVEDKLKFLKNKTKKLNKSYGTDGIVPDDDDGTPDEDTRQAYRIENAINNNGNPIELRALIFLLNYLSEAPSEVEKVKKSVEMVFDNDESILSCLSLIHDFRTYIRMAQKAIHAIFIKEEEKKLHKHLNSHGSKSNRPKRAAQLRKLDDPDHVAVNKVRLLMRGQQLTSKYLSNKTRRNNKFIKHFKTFFPNLNLKKVKNENFIETKLKDDIQIAISNIPNIKLQQKVREDSKKIMLPTDWYIYTPESDSDMESLDDEDESGEDEIEFDYEKTKYFKYNTDDNTVYNKKDRVEVGIWDEKAKEIRFFPSDLNNYLESGTEGSDGSHSAAGEWSGEETDDGNFDSESDDEDDDDEDGDSDSD